MNHFPIWHVINTSTNSVNLYKSDESNYIVTKDGEWTPIIACGIYVVINQPLLSFFQQHLDVQISSHAISIYDRESNQYFEGYYRIYIENRITSGTLDMVDHTGMNIWCHEGSGGIFISSAMKSALDESDIEGVETIPGFSGYGGAV